MITTKSNKVYWIDVIKYYIEENKKEEIDEKLGIILYLFI
ncbi:hypothetical protein B739_1815 [Riemerella anatipestifer RA-CH-1]|uniref:Uncharacterized protein n=2 Tax=Riemerella anatipestifer TaxID=34085 RepID=J9R3F4_RIEAN|nr:hypothetical protein B739_1815 [Riemerella anatipestifer RA-CH-1]AIH01179.1 hypothetical protein M949_0008 [Riemerella anatipestifer CH3]